MVPLVAMKAEFDAVKAIIDGCAEAVAAATGETIRLYSRNDDRAAARGAARRGDRRERGILLVRHQ